MQKTRKCRKFKCLKHLNYSKVFIEYSNDLDDIYKNIEKYNQNKKHKRMSSFSIWKIEKLR